MADNDDAIKSMVSHDFITECIVHTNQFGNAISVISCDKAWLFS